MKLGLINNRYGTKRGLAVALYYRSLLLMGGMKRYHVDWAEIQRLVFICSGNICRSPFAEAVARSQGMEAISCGLRTAQDLPANARARQVASELGYKLSAHKTTPIMYAELGKNDLLISMEPWQAMVIDQYANRPYHNTLLGLWGKPLKPYIHDPYDLSMDYFKHCFSYIEQSVTNIVQKINDTNR